MPKALDRLLHQLTGVPSRARTLFKSEIWTTRSLQDRTVRGRLFGVLRIVSLTWVGLVDHKLVSRAAALSYSSLLGIGPLIAIAVLFSGFALDRGNTDEVVRIINKGILFIAPQVGDFEAYSQKNAQMDEIDGEPANPHLASMLENFIEGSKSATVGLVGGLVLILIVIQLFSSIEDAFNTIWGVRRGRNWLVRIGLYWTVVDRKSVV